MAKTRPYFKFYVSDFLTDSNVRCMNTEQVGAYVLLLLQAWTEEPCATLPDNDSRLARLAGLSIERWMESRDTVLAPFARYSDGRIVQKRLRAEFEAMCREANEKAANGKKGAEKRWQGHGTTIAPPSQHHGYSDSDSDSDKDKTRVSECADAIALIVHLAKRDLSRPEQSAVNRDHAAAVATGHGELWLASARQMAQEPGFTFETVTGALRYLAAILNRCRDTGAKPGDQRTIRLAVTPDTDTPEQIRAIVEEATARGRRNRA